MDAQKTRLLIALMGLAMVLGFFLPWIDLGHPITVSGYEAARRMHEIGWTELTLIFVPIAGLAILIAAITDWKYTRLLSAGSAFVLIAIVGAKIARAFLATTGFGLWIVIAATIGALLVPLMQDPKKS